MRAGSTDGRDALTRVRYPLEGGRWWLGVCGYAVESNQTFQGMRFREWVGATLSPLNCLAMGFISNGSQLWSEPPN
jgi:hypothetical protein